MLIHQSLTKPIAMVARAFRLLMSTSYCIIALEIMSSLSLSLRVYIVLLRASRFDATFSGVNVKLSTG